MHLRRSKASIAAERRWKNKAARKRASLTMRSRIVPEVPESPPSEVQDFARRAAKQDITIISATRGFGYTQYPHAWVLAACDPDPAAVHQRWERLATASNLFIKEFVSNPLLGVAGVGVACVVVPKKL